MRSALYYAVLHYGLLGLPKNWQLCFIFDGLLLLKLLNVDVKLLSYSNKQNLTFTIDVADVLGAFF